MTLEEQRTQAILAMDEENKTLKAFLKKITDLPFASAAQLSAIHEAIDYLRK